MPTLNLSYVKEWVHGLSIAVPQDQAGKPDALSSRNSGFGNAGRVTIHIKGTLQVFRQESKMRLLQDPISREITTLAPI